MNAYFRDLNALLRTEREADLEQYLQLTRSVPVQDRRANGLTWYPLAIRSVEPTRGDYLSVEVERTTHTELAHQFRFGANVALFSNRQPDEHREEGTITFVGGNRMRITFRVEELPDWADDGKLGVDLLFDQNSYDEMERALQTAGNLDERDPQARLLRLLTGATPPALMTASGASPVIAEVPGHLNPSQAEAVMRILSAEALAIVHGPPGTGKTTTLVEAIRLMRQHSGGQMLVVAPSNTAVDLLSEKLAAQGLDVLRVGNPARVSEELQALTLDAKLAAHPEMKEIRKLKKQAAEYKNMAHKYKRRFGRAEQAQRKALFDEAHKIMKEVSRAEQYLADDLLDRAHVITATLVGANHYTVRDRDYAVVVIDEAGQALEPACWIPILKAQKLVMAGDPFQLPPTVKSPGTFRDGLACTLLEKAIDRHPASVSLLREQYRMNTEIQDYSSNVFYGGLLSAHPSVEGRRLFPGDEPFIFIDTAGCGFDEQPAGTSVQNPDEAALLVRHLRLNLDRFREACPDAPAPAIAIISPYKEQVKALAELWKADSGEPGSTAQRYPVSINTVDSFQGQERDVVYISLTRSNSEGVIGFLADIRRVNVAMTRAKKKLVIVGDSATLSRLPFYADLVTYASRLGGYRSGWEFLE